MKITVPTLSKFHLFAFSCWLISLAVWTPNEVEAQIRGNEIPEIRDVTVSFIGVSTVSEQLVKSHIHVRPGDEYDDLAIDRDIRNLYRTGLFEYIEVIRDFTRDDRVDLTYQVQTKYRIRNISFEGNQRMSNRRLRREMEIEPQTTLDERLVKNDAEAIFDHYQKNGYSQASVGYRIERDPATGTGDVIFEIDEGSRVRIASIEFEGNENVRSRELRKELETKRWHMFSWLTGSGRFKDDEFEDDLDTIRDVYREKGFLDVHIRQDEIEMDFVRENRLVITVPVEEGRRYRVGDISFAGNEIQPSVVLRNLLRLRPGDVYVPSRLDEDMENIRRFYGQFGYLDVWIQPQRIPNIETGNIDIVYNMEEGDRFDVESIKIEGNTKTKSVVIIRELGIAPGDVFDLVRMNVSEARLRNTRFFDEVDLTDERTQIPGRRDLKVRVREGRTGNLSFGAGFSSIERAVFFIELSQGNFDLFNWRKFFQGAGQKFRLRLQVGSRSNEVVLSFEEPWLFHRQLALGFTIFRTETEFLSAAFDERRLGFEVFLRKRLIELIEGRLSYSLQRVELFNVDLTGAPPGLDPGSLSRTVSKVGFTLLRDTRDRLQMTTRGNRTELITEIAGGPVGGTVDYYRLEGRTAHFFPTFRAANQVLSLLGRMGSVVNFGDSDDVPFFDRYFLGGPDTLRGFEFRDVGPRDRTGQPTGGKSFGFFSAEYSVGLAETIRLAAFYDAGFVNRAAGDFNPRDFNDNVGFGVRIMVMGSPMRLDYGIPLTTGDQPDTGNRFSFSFGTRF